MPKNNRTKKRVRIRGKKSPLDKFQSKPTRIWYRGYKQNCELKYMKGSLYYLIES